MVSPVLFGILRIQPQPCGVLSILDFTDSVVKISFGFFWNLVTFQWSQNRTCLWAFSSKCVC